MREADLGGREGRAAGDAVMLLVLALVSIYTPKIIVSVWIGAVEGAGVGFNLILGVVSQALSPMLTVLFAGAVALTLAAGRKRVFGRDFDLACVAFVPFVVVQIMSSMFLQAGSWIDVDPGRPFHIAAAAVAYGWTGSILVLGWLQTRQRCPGGGSRQERAP